MLNAEPYGNSRRADVMKGLLVILLLSFALGLFMVDVSDPDFWWHLKTGEWIVEHGELPKEDPFSFATLQNDPFASVNRVKFILTQYWLAQVTIYKIYSLWGFAGISVFRALLLTLTVGVIILTMKFHRVNVILSLLIAAAALLVFRHFMGERPQLFSFFFAALLLYLLEITRRAYISMRTEDEEAGSADRHTLHASRYSLYVIPFLMCLWSNLHGGYIYGVVTILIYISSGWLDIFIGRLKGKGEPLTSNAELKPHILFTVIGVVAIAATLLNPNSYHGIVDNFRYQPAAYFQKITEMQPPYRFYREHVQYFIMLAFLTLLFFINIVRRKRTDTNHILLFLFNTALSINAVRFVPFFVIGCSFILGIYLTPLLPLETFKRKRWLEGVAAFATVLGITAFFIYGEKVSVRHLYQTGVNYGPYPYQAAKFLKHLPPGRLFNPYGWGGYLIWALYPGSQVFIDGRGLNQEVYLQYNEVEQLSGSEQYGGMPKWKAILDGYRIDYLLLSPLTDYASNWPLVGAIARDKDWKLIYADSKALIFIRDREEFREIVKQYNLSSDVAYASIAWQALYKARSEKEKTKVAEYYLIAADAFVGMGKVKNAQLSIQKALELDPENPAVKAYAKAIGKE